jgi:hypothetical protein
MRPILLSGHERALTQVKYNADGDIIFSVSKDHVVVSARSSREVFNQLMSFSAHGVCSNRFSILIAFTDIAKTLTTASG